MKVAIGFIPIASGPWMLKQGFAEMGIDAVSVVAAPHRYGYPYDIEIKTTQDITRLLAENDIFISMFGQSFVGNDIGYWQALGKKFITVFNGCDVRTPTLVSESGSPLVCMYCEQMAECNHDAKFKNMSWCLEYSDAVFCDLGVIECVRPEAERLGKKLYPYLQPIYLESKLYSNTEKSDFLPNQFTKERPLRITHAPSDRSKKGTQFVISAIEQLTARGMNVELTLVQGSHSQVVNALRASDLVIDQLLIGWYGTFAVEAIAMNCPVLCYINNKGGHYVPPGMITNSNDLVKTIQHYIDNPIRLTALLIEQRNLILPGHDAKSIASEMLLSVSNRSVSA